MRHTCHARGCDKPVPREMLMCRKHWYMVSKATRDAVWRTYREGQCDLTPPPSKAWHKAADKAIAEVFENENKLRQYELSVETKGNFIMTVIARSKKEAEEKVREQAKKEWAAKGIFIKRINSIEEYS